MRALRVVLVDDSPMLLLMLSAFLAGEPDLEVVMTFSGTASLLAGVQAARPDVVVLDNEMPGGHGVDALPALVAAVPGARVVMWSSDVRVAPLALVRGAQQFVGKEQGLHRLAEAVRRGRSAQ